MPFALQKDLLIVEPSSIRSLAADFPIFPLFKHSHLDIFHSYAVAGKLSGISSN